MPKLTTAQMKKAVEEFKKQFTGGFYHGSGSNKIKAFDPLKNTDPTKLETPGVTFVTRDPDFAESFLPGSERGGYKAGATMYPVKVKLGKHWNPEQEESQQVLKAYLEKMYPHEANPQDLVDIQKDMSRAEWTDIENPNFLQHLRDTGHDTFHVMEGGIPNVGVLKPENIRGKFAKFNPEDAESADFMKAEGGSVEGYAGGGKVGALTELFNLIKNQGGSAAAKRLEKAADLVPNLEKKFQPKALERAFTGDNASAVMVMNPGDFEKYATPLPAMHKEWGGFTVDDGVRGDYQDYLDYLGKLTDRGGFESVPYLQLDQKTGSFFPNIAGHEGRNRSDALSKLGDQSSLVQMMPRANLREGLPRRSQEEYLQALQEKLGYRPMVTPEPDFNPETGKDVSRGLIELPDMFAAGGNVVKKVLQHGKSVPFVHYSKAPNISELDPNRYGTGIKGAEAGRLKNEPDIRPRSYIYTKAGGRQPEQGLGPYKYEGVAEDIYPLHDDPAGYSAIAREKAIDPYMMQFGREMVDEKAHLNELERLIKGAGYRGYANDDVGLLFHPTPVIKAE